MYFFFHLTSFSNGYVDAAKSWSQHRIKLQFYSSQLCNQIDELSIQTLGNVKSLFCNTLNTSNFAIFFQSFTKVATLSTYIYNVQAIDTFTPSTNYFITIGMYVCVYVKYSGHHQSSKRIVSVDVRSFDAAKPTT